MRKASCISGFVLAALLLGTSLGLTACTTAPDGKPLASLTYQHLNPLPISVAQIDVSTTYDPLFDPNDISGQLPNPPDIALRRYAQHRFAATGSSGLFKFIIEDAKVYRRMTGSTSGPASWFKVDEKEEYKLNIRVALAHTRPDGALIMGSRVAVDRTLTIPTSYSLTDRDRKLNEFVVAAVDSVDRIVLRTVHEKFGVDTAAYMTPVPAGSAPVLEPIPVPMAAPVSLAPVSLAPPAPAAAPTLMAPPPAPTGAVVSPAAVMDAPGPVTTYNTPLGMVPPAPSPVAPGSVVMVPPASSPYGIVPSTPPQLAAPMQAAGAPQSLTSPEMR